MKREKRFMAVRFPVETIREAKKILTNYASDARSAYGSYNLYDDNDGSTTYDDEEEFLREYHRSELAGYYTVSYDRNELSIAFRPNSATVAVTTSSRDLIQRILDLFEEEYKLRKVENLSAADESGFPTTKAREITFEKTFDLPGFIVDEANLERICDAASHLVEPAGRSLSGTLVFNTLDGNRHNFASVKQSLLEINKEHIEVTNAAVSFRHKHTNAVTVSFTNLGKIAVTAVGKSPLFSYEFENVTREIYSCREDYGWGVRTFVLRDLGASILSFLAVTFTAILVASSFSYLTTKSSIVAFDTSLLVSSDTFYQKLEHAIKSKSQDEKIDALLLSVIKDIHPISGTLQFYWNGIVLSSLMLVVVTISAIALRSLKSCYPLSFFEFQWNKKILDRMKRKREIIGVVLITGFLVNIVAGLVIVFLTK